MVAAMGFGFDSKRETRKRRKRRKIDFRSSVNLEKEMNKYLGSDWSESCAFNVIDSYDQKILYFEVPVERHDFFTAERQEKLKQVALSFGFDEIEISLVNIKKHVLTKLRKRGKILHLR
jgi:hypothetical protein